MEPDAEKARERKLIENSQEWRSTECISKRSARIDLLLIFDRSQALNLSQRKSSQGMMGLNAPAQSAFDRCARWHQWENVAVINKSLLFPRERPVLCSWSIALCACFAGINNPFSK
jgi:hypothetical protein